jgi:hypothetical protein
LSIFDLIDPQRQQQFQRYAQATDENRYDDIDDREAVDNVRDYLRQASPQEREQIFQEYFQRAPQEQRQQMQDFLPQDYRQQMDPNDPRSMARGYERATQKQFDPTPESPLEQIFSPGGALSSPVAKAAIIGIAGMIGKQLLNRR